MSQTIFAPSQGGTGVNNGTNTITLGGNLTTTGAVNISGSNTGDQTTITGNAGSATVLQTARTIAGTSFNGSANISLANKFIVQGTTDSGLSSSQFLGALGTGIIKNTTTTGILSIAVAGDFPTLNQNTTGSAATLTTGRTIAITGDLTYTSPAFNGSANITAAGTLATVNSNVGTFTNATITVNAKGLITAASTGSGGSAGVQKVAVIVTTGSISFTTPATTTSTTLFKITLVGGGSGGATGSSGNVGGGGGGQTVIWWVTGLAASTTYTGTLGTGGASGSSGGSVGSAGGSTSITIGSNTVTAGGGAAQLSASIPGLGGSTSNSPSVGTVLSIPGQAGGLSSAPSPGGSSHYGYGGNNIASAAGYGAGGLGTATGGAAGAGTAGLIFIEYLG